MARNCASSGRGPDKSIHVITILMSTAIASDRQRVWRALTDPAELVAWDESIIARIDEPDGYPTVGKPMRWRYRLGSVQLVLHDKPRKVAPLDQLQASLSLGSLRFERTFRLKEEIGDPVRTQLGIKLIASNSVPVLGSVVDRFDVRRTAAAHADNVLRSVQKWCENNP